MADKILFLTLKVFSASGGIEKVCKVASKALYELGLQSGGRVKIFSMYDNPGYAGMNKYFSQIIFTGFGKHKAQFVLKSLQQGRKCRIVILSHVNLLLVGYLIKKISPSTKVVLLAHGIEVWQPFPSWKKRMLKKCDLILPVSHFTREKMKLLYGISDEKFRILNNCLDPFLEMPIKKEKDPVLLERYGLRKDKFILLTVSRMVDTEQYKGYDKVLQVLPGIVQENPGICYLLVGKYDEKEKERLDDLIDQLNRSACRCWLGRSHRCWQTAQLAAHHRSLDDLDAAHPVYRYGDRVRDVVLLALHPMQFPLLLRRPLPPP